MSVGPSKLRNALKKSNAAGYAKRVSQKGKKTVSFDDVYEYAPSQTRRAKVGLEYDQEEVADRHQMIQRAADDDADLGGMRQDGRDGLRARLLGEHQDDEQVDSGDDEEIDSDGAFEESDEEKFAGFNFSTTKRSKSSRAPSKKSLRDVDLNEHSRDLSSDADHMDSLEEDDGDGEEREDADAENFFDVLEIFDGKAGLEDGESTMQPMENIQVSVPGTSDQAGESEEEMSQDEQEEQDDEERSISASDDDDSPEALVELEGFLLNLDPAEGKKRKTDDASAAKSFPKKRRVLEERTEAGAEGEFGVSSGGSTALKLDDLLAPLASSSALTALKKSIKPLISTSNKTKTLSAPLPQRAQERLDREAAYEQTKQEVDKWSATMKRIKQAEHLSFPLQAQSEGRVSNLELAAKFKPSNELESAVDNLLKSAQLRDEDIPATEALKMAHLSVEEVAVRRAELRMMRELAFRADKKAKRIAKIKSKTYRRIRKKQRAKLDGDEDDGAEDARTQLEAEIERARERATLRHTNTGKWATTMQGREGLGVDQRQAIGEMLDRGEKLRRRIQGQMSGDESEDHESDDEEHDVEAIKQNAFDELVTLNSSENASSTDIKSNSVFNMKFMRDAAARQMREADAEADDFVKEMGEEKSSEADDDASAEGAAAAAGPSIERMGGRVTYRPSASSLAASAKPAGSRASETSSVTLQSADLVQDDPKSVDIISVSSPAISSVVEESNPWLVASSSSGSLLKKNEVLVQKGSSALAKSTHKLKKQSAKGGLEQEHARDDAVLEIDANQVFTIVEPSYPLAVVNAQGGPNGKKKPKDGSVAADADIDAGGDESDGHSEVDEQERALERKRQGAKGKGVAAFKQRELVSLAFAGDNVVQAFDDLKQKAIDEDAPREVDTTLPGWGSWGGSGTKTLPPRPHLIKKIAGVDPSARADHKKAHIIISEKRDKKAAKYLVKELPYPYTSHAQYARSMDIPIGAEWNSRVGFQRGTLPRVVKKMGTVIEPLVKPH